MKRILHGALICALIVVMSMTLWPASVSAQGTAIYVDDDFPDTPEYHALHMWDTIQKGIDDATDDAYDTVYVYEGTYDGNINVNKRNLTVLGDPNALVTINGAGSDYAIQITAHDVTVKQLTITGGNQAGIRWVGVSNGYIENTDVSGSTGYGIFMDTITNQTIQCNTVYNNGLDGIRIKNSSLKDLFDNHTHHNINGAGIFLESSTQISTAYNESNNNDYGIYVDSTSTNNDIYLNNFHDNTTADSFVDCDANDCETPGNPAPVPSCTEQETPSPPTPPGDGNGNGGGGGGGCFIATAAYGSYLDSHVETLRNFRDSYMVTNPVGSALVSLYYKLSPPVADFIDEHPALKPIVRVGLMPAVAMSTVAVNTTLGEKAAIVGSLALISILLIMWRRQRSRRLGRS